MIMKTYRILGKRGRTTIPFEIRQTLGFSYNDVISFEQRDGGVFVKKEKICDNCRCVGDDTESKDGEISLLEFVDSLSSAEQKALLVHLAVKQTGEKVCG